MRFVVIMAKGGFLPCEGNILDHYDEKHDKGLLIVCDDCKHYRLFRCDSKIKIDVELCCCGEQVSRAPRKL